MPQTKPPLALAVVLTATLNNPTTPAAVIQGTGLADAAFDWHNCLFLQQYDPDRHAAPAVVITATVIIEGSGLTKAAFAITATCSFNSMMPTATTRRRQAKPGGRCVHRGAFGMLRLSCRKPQTKY